MNAHDALAAVGRGVRHLGPFAVAVVIGVFLVATWLLRKRSARAVYNGRYDWTGLVGLLAAALVAAVILASVGASQ